MDLEYLLRLYPYTTFNCSSKYVNKHKLRTGATLTILSSIGSLGHHLHVQSLLDIVQDLHRLPIHAYLHNQKDHPAMRHHGRLPDRV